MFNKFQHRGFSYVKTVFVFVLFCTCIAFGETVWIEQEKIMAPSGDVSASASFGRSISVSGEYIIVGAEEYDGPTTADSGAAYIYHYDGTNWVLQATLTASDSQAGDRFGCSVSIDGNYAVVGSYGCDGESIDSGAAYIFEFDNTSWLEKAKLTALDATSGDYFGYSVAISGNYTIIGVYQDDDCGRSSGSAYIFYRDDPAWVQQQKLIADDGDEDDYFGRSVAINGAYAIIGAIGNDDNGESSGSAYIFHRSDTTWTQQEKLTASNAAAQDCFGGSVSISDDFAIVGADETDGNGDSSGSAYIFQRSDTTWAEHDILAPSDASAGDNFGCSAAISGDKIIIGASNKSNDGITMSGAAYIFKLAGNSWSQHFKVALWNADILDRFGWNVAIDQDVPVVGTYRLDTGFATVLDEVPCINFDLNCDGRVNTEDLIEFSNLWLQEPDGLNMTDFGILAGQWLDNIYY